MFGNISVELNFFHQIFLRYLSSSLSRGGKSVNIVRRGKSVGVLYEDEKCNVREN